MKAVLISIQPKWCEKIANGEKTIEVRKSKPKLETTFKVYIYETQGKKVECGFHFEETGRTLREKYVFGMHEARIVKHYCNEGKGKVIGEFVCDRIDEYTSGIPPFNYPSDGYNVYPHELKEMCLGYKDLDEYGKGKSLYGWHISELKIYDNPKALSEFWAYNEELHKRYEAEDNYCAWGNCETESGITNDCDGEDIKHCYQCWNEWSGWCHKVKIPPQSWCYVEVE